ncbi:MAG: ATP-binding protein, partial [Candidatus Hydrogenedentes bacterium]|nr:ATP-binding protein [Candidatus Hydrogenedentota bacterium]
LDDVAVDRLAQIGDNGSPGGPVSERLGVVLAQHVSDDKRRGRKSKKPTYPLLEVPLSVDETKIGSLTVAGHASKAFASDDHELLFGFAGGAAVAIQRSQLAAEARVRLDHLSGLYSLSQAISTLGDFNETLAHVVDQIAAVLDVERCMVLLLDEDREELVGHSHAYGLEPGHAASISMGRVEATASWQVLETGEAFVSNDTASDDRITPRYVDLLGDESLLIVPMRVGETPIGVIRASNRRGAGFTESDARLMNIFAAQAAVIVQNAGFLREVTREAEQLEAIIGEASDGIAIVDSLGRIITFNAAMETITGWPREEVIGRDCEELIRAPSSRPDDALKGAFPLKQVLQTQQSVPYSESVLLHRDGRRVDVGASYSFVPSPWDESPLAVAIVRDISAIKEVEGLKSDFVSLVSHELRTPLALIKGYIATLLSPDVDLDSGTELRFREGINEAADRLVLIVNNLLSASRIESGLFRPHLKEMELEPVVERLVSEFQESGHGELDLRWRGKDFNIVADGEQIALVLSNLVGNAIKYAGEDEHLAIQITVDGRENDIAVTVRDRGIGIPNELRARVFEKFYRGPESVSAPGSGLGLYICQKVVEAHGGSLELNGGSEVGTQISFTLPRNQGSDLLDEKSGHALVTEG